MVLMPNTPVDSELNRLTLEDAILTAMANARAGEQPATERVSVLPALHSYMSPDLVANTNGQVMLIHEKPLPTPIWWVDYDPEYSQLIFVTITGQIIDLGVNVPPVIGGYLRHGRDIAIVEIDMNGKVLNVQERKIVVRQTGMN